MLHLVHSGPATIRWVHLLGTKKKECSCSLIGFIHCGEAISRATNTMLIVNDLVTYECKPKCEDQLSFELCPVHCEVIGRSALHESVLLFERAVLVS
jgi:hypothetical protein